MNIRLATLNDYDAIHAIEATASRALGSRYPARMKRSISKGLTFVATVRNGVVGFVEWNNPQRGKNAGLNVIYKIAVLPEYRRQGIGSALLGAVPNPQRLLCPNGIEANEFYQALGYDWVRFDGKLNTYQLGIYYD